MMRQFQKLLRIEHREFLDYTEQVIDCEWPQRREVLHNCNLEWQQYSQQYSAEQEVEPLLFEDSVKIWAVGICESLHCWCGEDELLIMGKDIVSDCDDETVFETMAVAVGGQHLEGPLTNTELGRAYSANVIDPVARMRAILRDYYPTDLEMEWDNQKA